MPVPDINHLRSPAHPLAPKRFKPEHDKYWLCHAPFPHGTVGEGEPPSKVWWLDLCEGASSEVHCSGHLKQSPLKSVWLFKWQDHFLSSDLSGHVIIFVEHLAHLGGMARGSLPLWANLILKILLKVSCKYYLLWMLSGPQSSQRMPKSEPFWYELLLVASIWKSLSASSSAQVSFRSQWGVGQRSPVGGDRKLTAAREARRTNWAKDMTQNGTNYDEQLWIGTWLT